MSKNLVIAGVVVLVIILAGGYFVMSSQSKKTNSPDSVMMEETKESPTEAIGEEKTGTAEGVMMDRGNVKEFTVEGQPFSFTPNKITVKRGDTVKINFVNKEGFHDFTIDEFNARTKQLQAGQSETIEFVADQTGEFEYYCSVGNHRAQGMVGTLTVQ